jgi:hypothetical protein
VFIRKSRVSTPIPIAILNNRCGHAAMIPIFQPHSRWNMKIHGLRLDSSGSWRQFEYQEMKAEIGVISSVNSDHVGWSLASDLTAPYVAVKMLGRPMFHWDAILNIKWAVGNLAFMYMYEEFVAQKNVIVILWGKERLECVVSVSSADQSSWRDPHLGPGGAGDAACFFYPLNLKPSLSTEPN